MIKALLLHLIKDIIICSGMSEKDGLDKPAWII